jgi:integrase
VPGGNRGRAPGALARAQARLRPKHLANHELHVRRFLVPQLGDRPLAALTADEVEDFVGALSARASRRGTPFAAGTVRLALVILRQALTYAVARGLVARNVAAARGDRHEALYRVAIVLGLRQGELLGLRWANVDLDGGRLTVCEQLQRRSPAEPAAGQGPLVLRGLKSDAAHRTLPLPPALVALLREHKAAQERERARCSAEWNARGLVFVSRKGTPLDGAHLTVACKKIVAAAGLPLLRFHDLRHCAASFLGADGVPVEVAKAILGHSNVRLTLNRYRHIQPEGYERAVAAMERRLATL